MTKYILLFIITLISFESYSQNISLDDVLQLRKKDLAYVEEYLLNKNWEFTKGEDATETTLETAQFIYCKTKSGNCEAILNYMTNSTVTDGNRISITLFKKESYNNYLKRIKDLGCQLINSKVIKESIVKLYKGKTTSFEIITFVGKINSEDIITYNINIMSNEVYSTNVRRIEN